MFTFPVAHFSSSASGVSIEKSALFDADSQNLSRSQGSGNAGVWTWAAWLYKTHSMNQVFLNFGTGGAEGQLGLASSDKLYLYDGATTVFLTTQLFRDIGWYHIHVAYNTGASGSDKVKLSVNGSLVSAFDTDNRSSANDFEDCNTSGQTTYLGNNSSTSDGIYFRGYMSQACMVDGSAVAVGSFIDTSDDGYVTPKADADIKALADAGASANSYFLDNSSNPETDSSTHGNSFTNNGTVTTANHTPTHIEALWNPYFKNSSAGSPTLTNGNKTIQVSSTSEVRVGQNLIIPTVGKWIMGVSQAAVDDTGKAFGIWTTLTQTTGFPSVTGLGGWHVTTSTNAYQCDGTHIINITTSVGTPQAADQFWICADVDNGKIFFGFWDNSASSITWYAADGGTDVIPVTGDNPSQSIDVCGATFAGTGYNDKTFTLVEEADIPFTIPTGYKFLNTTNIASAIKPSESQLSDHFAIKLFTGDGGASKALTFGGTNNMQPDLIISKNRSTTGYISAWDSLRGATKVIYPSEMTAESTDADGLLSFDSDGFTVGADAWINGSGNSIATWCFKASGPCSATNSAGAGATPTANSVKIDGSNLGSALAGTIPVTKLSANTNFGFSVGKYVGTGSAGTVAHGLNGVPELILCRGLDSGGSVQWLVYHSAVGNTKALHIDDNSTGNVSTGYWNDTTPTSSVFSIGNSSYHNASSLNVVFYAFKQSPYISISKYEGNANADGCFAVTEGTAGPITPVMALIKSMDHTQSWFLRDTARNPSNPITKDVYPDLGAQAEATGASMDIVRGGMKQRVSSDSNSAYTYVYMAIGHPIISADGLIKEGR